MVCSDGLSSRQSQAKSGLAVWMIIMRSGSERSWDVRQGTHDNY